MHKGEPLMTEHNVTDEKMTRISKTLIVNMMMTIDDDNDDFDDNRECFEWKMQGKGHTERCTRVNH